MSLPRTWRAWTGRARVAAVVVLLVAPPDLAGGADRAPAFPARIIVKLRAEGDAAVHACAETLHAEGRSFASWTGDASDSLDRVHAELGVVGVRAVFRVPDGSAFATQRARALDGNARLRARYPVRSARARRGAEVPDLSHVYAIQLPPGADARRAAAIYGADPHVEWAQPDHPAALDLEPDDPFFSSNGSWGQPYPDLWGLYKVRAPSAWEAAQGEGVVVAVVDTGLDYGHPDIAANVWINPGEDLDGSGALEQADLDGRDNDGNGFVDDIVGFDFDDRLDAEEQELPGPGDADPFDPRGHGTHVAGTIAAVGQNGLGIIGVAPRAKIMAVKGFPSEGSGSLLALVRGMVYAVENGADVINNSWSCGRRCPENPMAEEAVAFANAHGVVVVTSAGNKSDDVVHYSPEKLRGTISVGSSDPGDAAASSSSFGLLMDVVAPGSGFLAGPPSLSPRRSILSLKARDSKPPVDGGGAYVVGDDYVRMTGTSMAAPHVAGAVALLLSQRPTLTIDDVRELVRESAADLGAPGPDRRFGSGRLDAGAALALDVPTLRASFAGPAPGVEVVPMGERIDVRGSVTGSVVDYALCFGRGLDPDEWKQIGGLRSAPFENETMVLWDVSGLADGPVTLRLTAWDPSGRSVEEFLPFGLERNAPTRVSSPGPPAAAPDVSGDKVVWQSERTALDTETRDGDKGGEGEPDDEGLNVFVTDLTDGSERPLLPPHASSGDQTSPKIAGDLVVWWDAQGEAGRRCRLGAAGTHCAVHRLPPPGASGNAPDVSGDWIAWSQPGGESGGVRVCRVWRGDETCPVRRVAGAATGQSEPVIDDLRLVFRDDDSGPLGLSTCRFEPLTGSCALERISESPVLFDPAVSGDMLAWAEFGFPSSVLRLCDAGDAAGCRPISIAASASPRPALSGRRLVWQAGQSSPEDGDSDIFLCEYDPVRKVCPVQRLTGSLADQWSPAIDGDRVVWQDGRNGGSAIYTLELPSFEAIRAQGARVGRPLRIRVVAHDPGGRPLALSARTLGGDPVGSLAASFEDRGDGEGELSWTPRLDQVGDRGFVFEAVAQGGLRTSVSVPVGVAAEDGPPVARAGPDRLGFGASLRLDGCDSHDPDGEVISHVWRDWTGRELGATCAIEIERPAALWLALYALRVSDGAHSDRDWLWVLWLPGRWF